MLTGPATLRRQRCQPSQISRPLQEKVQEGAPVRSFLVYFLREFALVLRQLICCCNQDLVPSDHGFAKLRLLMEAVPEACTVCSPALSGPLPSATLCKLSFRSRELHVVLC